jgi:DNA-binding NtrC family response regulator
MHKRKILYLQPGDAKSVALSALTPDWDIHAAALEAPPPLEDYQVGLILLAGTHWKLERVEALLANGPLEWIALIPPGGLAEPELAQLVLRYCIDYHTLPVEAERLRAALGHAYGMGALRQAWSGQSEPPVYHRMVGTSPAIRQLVSALGKVAAVEAPVLIQGETGTGKELAAQAIHESSGRAGGPFVPVNCGALPSGLIQSELFGHERGAFTGAQRRKIGRLEAANGGTIFLDEIGDLSLDLQVNLLRFLQEGVIERVGGGGAVSVDVRVVAATHVDLEAAVAAGRFRADLYYRLNVLRLWMPALRARGSDVSLLAEYFFRRFSTDKAPAVQGFSPEALQAMAQHSWPGNVRELINRVRRAMVMCEGRWITPADLGLTGEQKRSATLAEVRRRAERSAVESALQASGYNVADAAQRLGVSRVTLYRLMDKYGLQTPAARAADAEEPTLVAWVGETVKRMA